MVNRGIRYSIRSFAPLSTRFSSLESPAGYRLLIVAEKQTKLSLLVSVDSLHDVIACLAVFSGKKIISYQNEAFLDPEKSH